MQIFKFYDTDQMGTLRPLEKLRWNEELFCVTLSKKMRIDRCFFPGATVMEENEAFYTVQYLKGVRKQ